ncbi:MAG: hydantoinase/oxoprolinase family protein [Proteobacteria bacterium]|nr:hydantoinase/oxoprolinase family protein [Pseudomonadota bacterium]MBI3500133.1 hydantoinase/oxoprolinase family protein [Pseudomonadota bacterium]
MTILAVDIGGTFTDVCCLYETPEGRRLSWTKEPSTRRDPVQGLVRGVERMLSQVRAQPSEVSHLLHGTTVGTNAVLERRGGRVGMLFTDGFEDTIELGRGDRREIYRLDAEPQTPGFIAPGRRRRGIKERIGANGSVVVPLDQAGVADAVRELVESERIEALAVCLLFSFINPRHELGIRDIVRSLYPDLPVSLSHEVDPVFREYERSCLTAFDAYLRPVMGAYLGNLTDRLREAGLACEVFTMQSRGGLASTRIIANRPFTALLSGPAAGVVGALKLARAGGFDNGITLDMGGTSADIALIATGRALTTSQGRFERYPLRTPMVDITTLGAGGGSIAWVDGAGGLHVGPQSAGSEPGPACYGRGGTEATVTDASIVLGYLSPDYFAGGLRLDPDAAWRSVERIGARVGLSTVQAAHGIHSIVNARIADGTRLVSLKRGYDPREFALVLFGGAGPVNGLAIAEELGMGTAVVPFAPGALCAYGLLAAAVEYDDAATFKVPVEDADPARIEAAFQRLHRVGLERMIADRVPAGEVIHVRTADMRYIGQAFELEVPVGNPVSAEILRHVIESFHAAHRRVYGHAAEDSEVEFVNLRTVHSYRIDRDERPIAFVPAALPKPPQSRRCCFAATGDFVDTPVNLRSDITDGRVLSGPAVIHQADSTTVVRPGWTCRVDAQGNLLLGRKKVG